MKTLTLLCCFLFGGTSLGLAQAETKEPPRLTELRDFWLAAKSRAFNPINDRYREQLKTLKTKLTKAGQLDKAVKTDEELLRLDQALEKQKAVQKTITDGDGVQLAKLNAIWIKGREQAVKRLNDHYHKELSKLLKELSKEGDLQRAVKVQEELRNLKVETVKDRKRPAFKTALLGHNWTWRHKSDSKSWFKLKEDGSGEFRNRSGNLGVIKWNIIAERTIHFELKFTGKPRSTHLKWAEDLKSFTGTDIGKDNRREVWGAVLK